MEVPAIKTTSPNDGSTIKALWKLQKIILGTLDFPELAKKSVNSILTELDYLELGYRILVLGLINEKKGILERVAISETQEAKTALEVTPVPFHDIIIPLNDPNNILIKAINTGKVYYSTDWFDILTPAYTREEASKVQEIVGIKTSMVYPLIAQGKPIGILIFSMVKDYSEVTEDEKNILEGFADLVGLAVQRSLLFNSLQKTSLQLQEANLRLRELDQLKDDFVSIASHELRTPMTAIRSYAWMALYRSDVPLSEKLRRYLSRTLLSTERLINLVNDMLNISRIESGRIEVIPTSFDIRVLVNDVISEVDAKAKEKLIKIQLTETNLPQVFADPDKVHQVLLNLLGNALKFTPNNGLITISYFSDGLSVEVNVKDSGVGISEDDLSRLFKKFGRLDDSYVAAATSGGTGLGLYICKNLIELMKGKIWARSDGFNKGATFTFSLPTATPKVIAESEKYTKKVKEGDAKILESVAI